MKRYIRLNKTLFIYAIVLAGAAFLFEWLEYQYAIKVMSVEVYTVIVAGGFTLLGVWLGKGLFSSKPDSEFKINYNVINTLGLTERELEVLQLLAHGETNKAIAKQLFVAPNTIKTHVLNIYKKLDVERRTQAVQKAKELQIIP